MTVSSHLLQAVRKCEKRWLGNSDSAVASRHSGFEGRPAKFPRRFHYQCSPKRKSRWKAQEQVQRKLKTEQSRVSDDYDRRLPFAFLRLQ
jgi:hypothetical protein